MSKLMEQLRHIYENTVQPMGFRAAREERPKQMLVIACLPQGDRGRIEQLAGGGVDAILQRGKRLEEETLGQIAEAVGDMPWGVWPDAISEGYVERLGEAGGDFVVLEASTAPAGLLLEDEEVGKVLKVDPGEEEGLVCAISQLSVEAVLLDLRGEGKYLTVAEMMQCHRLAGAVDRPLLVSTQKELGDKEIQSLWEAGVRGLVLELKGDQLQKILPGLTEAIKALPAKAKKGGERSALLPRLEYSPEADEDE